MKTRSLQFLLGLALTFAFFVTVAEAQDIPSQLNGRLVALRGKSVLPFAAPDLPQAKYIALYYSAGWCGPCHQFTPDLVKFYHEMKSKYSGFEVIFMSKDESANAMEKYMGEMAMPWPAVRYSALKGNRALNKYAGPAIPCLVVVNEKGEVLSDSFAGTNYLGPHKVMADLKKLLSGESGGVAHSDLGTPAPGVTTASKAADNAVKSPSGTNWDEVFKKKSP
jgi:nucleoredoxin